MITGAGGYIGSLLLGKLAEGGTAGNDGRLLADAEPAIGSVSELAGDDGSGTGDPGTGMTVVAVDVREIPLERRVPGVIYEQEDVRSENLSNLMQQYQVDTVVHLASIVTPGKKSNREFEYSVDVLGTKNVLQGCIANKVQHIVLTSSGAAYGYHVDNPEWITEEHSIRGNTEFAYSYHKRLVEEMLAEYRSRHPELKQTIFRIGTILGSTVNNQITQLFEKKRLIGVRGSKSPFVFIWDDDVVSCIREAIIQEREGIYNLAGDGALSVDEIAALLGKKVRYWPASVLVVALFVLKKLRLTQYGPEQVNFIRYRPVLSNSKLKSVFGYTPQLTTKEVFEKYIVPRGKRKG